MSNLIMQTQAEVRILEFKLDKIRKRIENRLTMVDPIVQNELQAILSMISEYETVPTGWKLEKPLVNIADMEDVE